MVQQKKHFWQFQQIEWRPFIGFLVVANLVTIALPWAIYAGSLVQQAVSPVEESGWGLLLLTPLWYAGVMFAIVNVVTLGAYLFRRRPRTSVALVCMLLIVLSAAYPFIFLR